MDSEKSQSIVADSRLIRLVPIISINQHNVETAHEIFSSVILSLLLIQKSICQFLVKECAQVLVNSLED